MDTFTTSTQNQHWLFTTEKLYDLYHNSHSKLPVSIQQLQLLLLFYEQKTKDFAKAFKLSPTTQLTTILLLKRYYLNNYKELKLVFLGCLYLAMKIHGYHIEVEDFLAKIPNLNVTASKVLEYEIIVAESLQFEFQMHHPLICVQGILFKFKEYLVSNQINIEIDIEMKTIIEQTNGFVMQSYYSNAPLLYSPALIALSCFSEAVSQSEFKSDFDKFKASFKTDSAQIKQVWLEIEKGSIKPDKNVVKAISKQLENI